MKITKETEQKVTIEFDLFDFGNLQEFLRDSEEAVNEAGKFEYDTIQKLLNIQLSNPTILNDIRLAKINAIFEKNRQDLEEDKRKK